MKIKKIFIILFSFFIVLFMTSCIGDVSIDYYEDINGGKTIISSDFIYNNNPVNLKVEGQEYLKPRYESICYSPDGKFMLTVLSLKSTDIKSTYFYLEIYAYPNQINKNVYVQTKNIEFVSETEEAPTIYSNKEDKKLSSMFSYGKYLDYISIECEIDSSTHKISEYNYYLDLTFAGNDYKFKLF